MYDICITNRHLVKGDYLKQIDRVMLNQPKSLILREKDLTEQDYKILAEEVLKKCHISNVEFVINNFVEVAIELNEKNVQLSFGKFIDLPKEKKALFNKIGVSVHSVFEAQKAQICGADYLIAGHIFTTKCKEGLEPRGLSFLSEVCKSVNIPVYAIGGINKNNAPECIKAGASGVCMMSEYMKL